jgi:hypothetical protein
MSARETFKRRSKERDQSDQPITQTDFSEGLIKNHPHEEILGNALAKLRNAHAFPTEIQPRLGTKIIPFDVPEISGGYVLTKTNTIVTSLSGNIFTEPFVSNYLVWPDEDVHDEIIELISPTQVRVHRCNNKPATAGCWIHGRLNLCEWHSSKKKVIWQWGVKVYTNDVYVDGDYLKFRALQEVICVSNEEPANVLSEWSELEEYGVIFNSRGIYLVNFNSTPQTLFKKNSSIPTVLPDDIPRGLDSKYRYDILYAMSRLEGQGIRTRTTAGVPVLQECGTTDIDKEKDPPRDNAICWTSKRINSNSRTNGKLYCNNLAAVLLTPSYWALLNNASFAWTVNGRTEEFVCDFSIVTGAAVTSLTDVAKEIQNILRLVFYAATCEYDADNTRFIFSSGEEDKSTVGYGTAGTGGTNIATLLCMTAASGATLDNANIYATPQPFGLFKIPEIRYGVREWHWTHSVMYRTPDIGPDGVTPRVGYNGELLPPLQLCYSVEVRVAGAMYASKDINGLVTAQIGTFEIYDVGTSLEWEDGDIDTIIAWVSAQQVYVVSDYIEIKPLQACAIGGGNVIRASQTGYIVTRTNGGTFSANDVRKQIWWSTDYVSIIEEFIDANTVRVYDSADRATQGITIDPIERMINDTTSDESIRNRFDELSVGALRSRFFYQMENSNVGTVCTGFMVTAKRNNKVIYYSQLGISLKYLSGYHLQSRQKSDAVEDAIQKILTIKNKIIVWCKGSTWYAPTTDAKILTLPEFGEAYATLVFDIVDHAEGITDIGSIEKIKSDLYEMVMTDNSLRQFDGSAYSSDFTTNRLGQNIVKKDLDETKGMGLSCYDNRIGHIIWRISK